MKILVKKSGTWAHRGIDPFDIKEGVQDYKDALAKELILNDWAVPYVEDVIEEITVETVGEFDRELAEEEYRDLGGRPRDDWSDDELVERIENKKAE